MRKLKKIMSNKAVKKGVTMFMCLAMMFTMGMSAFAAEGDSAVASEAVNQVKTAFSTVTSTISITNILSMVGVALAACVGFFFFWWGIRKVIKMVTGAFKKGKISV